MKFIKDVAMVTLLFFWTILFSLFPVEENEFENM